MTDTIFALSSGQPPAGIGVIRVSGPAASDALIALAGRLPTPRRTSLATLSDPASGDLLDRALLLWMPGPRTATGEDIAELHCHGGRAVTAAILASLGRVAGLRPAVAGEFTRRAFDNGVIDLNEAEGLGDLLLAETEGQRRAALAMAEGHFSRRIEGWRNRLNGLAAMVEAALDFSDEDDVPDAGIGRAVEEGIRSLAQDVRSELAKAVAERLRDGVRVVLAGPPNAGKSTLLNALVGRDAAIVSATPGTTRDRIEVPAAIGGTAFLFTDTAGLRASEDAVEMAGVVRAQAAMTAADILLWLGEPDDRPEDALCVATQIDRRPAADHSDFAVSALTGEGMPALVAGLLAHAQVLLPRTDDYALHARQRDGIETIASALEEAAHDDLLIVAEHLREARLALDALTGRAGIEDVLDALFGRFCIGK
jgi:tRNA modification GTPase